MRGKDLLAGVCLFAGGVLSAATIPQPSRIVGPSAGALLEPGATMAIEWPRVAEVEDVEEMELVLSLDGGRTFPLRVTRRIDPAATRWLWDVPALPTRHARLALRVGDDGPPNEERIVRVTDEFAIGARPRLPFEEISWVGGEGRTREALDAPPPPTLPHADYCGEEPPEPRTDSLDLPAPGSHLTCQRGPALGDHPPATRASTRDVERPHAPSCPFHLPLRL